jgi:hypothetical protein
VSEHTAEGGLEHRGDDEHASEFERTGDDAVDEVIARLETLSDSDELSRHVEALTDTHSALQRRLSAADG